MRYIGFINEIQAEKNEFVKYFQVSRVHDATCPNNSTVASLQYASSTYLRHLLNRETACYEYEKR